MTQYNDSNDSIIMSSKDLKAIALFNQFLYNYSLQIVS